METLIQPKVKLEISSFDNSTFQIKEKSSNSKLGLNSKINLKLFILILASCTFLIFPETPQDYEVVCKKYHSVEACTIW